MSKTEDGGSSNHQFTQVVCYIVSYSTSVLTARNEFKFKTPLLFFLGLDPVSCGFEASRCPLLHKRRAMPLSSAE
jgi:hypothetical protein